MKNAISHARKVFEIEAKAIAALAERLDENFEKAVEAILNCSGRVIVAGMGKSGLIGNKIVATFNSTGISSFFLHPAEALHGDIGLVRKDDILMLVSKSGQMAESGILFSAARRMGISIIALCGTVDSEIYQRADIPIDCSVEEEACPNNLVPTSSTTAALVMGDALAIALLEARDFTPENFAENHPGGLIGRRLLKKVSDFHHTKDEIPLVDTDSSMKEIIFQMTSKRMGCVLTVDSNQKLTGIFTDGDLRRLADSKDFYNQKAGDVIQSQPKIINENALLDAALAIMEEHSISQLASVDENEKLVGIIHIHDILKSKLV